MKSDYEAIAQAIFHAFDIRCEASTLDDEVERRLVDAQAWYFKNILGSKSLVLCRDGRLSSPHLLQLASERFVSAGFEVCLCLAPVTTCRFYYSCAVRDGCCGIMFTASHNPGYYTGQKIVAPGCVPIAEGIGPDGGLDSVKKAFVKGRAVDRPAPQKRGRITVFNDLRPYMQYWLDKAGISRGFLSGIRILADFLSGCAGEEISLALQYAGASLESRNSVPDGNFPCGTPNPIIKESIETTLSVLEASPARYDFCFCFDGDGDRVDIRLGDGRWISPALIISFIAPFASGRLNGGDGNLVGIDCKASPIAHRAIKLAGLRPCLVPNGHSKIKNLIAKDGLLCAAEETAHYYFRLSEGGRSIPIESTLFVCLVFLRCWKERKEEIVQLLKSSESVFTEREWSVVYENDSSRNKALRLVREFFEGNGYDTTDKLRNGGPLGAVLMKKNFGGDDWCWISQRSSQSEKGMARWTVSSSLKTELTFATNNIKRITETSEGRLL